MVKIQSEFKVYLTQQDLLIYVPITRHANENMKYSSIF